MGKILKKYTTIPQHLYVNRYADIQLKEIIEEMQRPGYVLVARQMGKTNLLFNAKRTLENDNRLFAYIDLSNLYINEKDCYRNIINNIIEPNLNVFLPIENDIEKIRKKNLPPHNEYSRCLIKILSQFKGDLVIILDEIDALKSINYSDNIFAQIRSNYFSRTNYPVLERLTYVLSGVIEPTELIKDKNKSPFNIGDKIYLDDFTKEEHNDFIEKSKLRISQTISDELFNWTNGNPRLTFDICAEIETLLINQREIDSDILKTIITNKYLTSFDIAPIDHIRELVKSNKDIRRAISSIHKRNTFEISDDIKKKLYLFGIINSKFNEEIRIKNKIIELSLSDEWIKSIEKENSFVYGLAKYSDKDYQGAIDILKEVILISQNERDIEGGNYFLGMSYLKRNEYENAIPYFKFDFKDQVYRNDSLAFLGVCQIGIGDKEQGMSTLEEAIKIESHTHAYHNALLNLAINHSNDDRALELFGKLFESTLLSDKSEADELDQLKSLSLYYQAEILQKRGDKPVAIEKIEKALEISNLSDSLFLMYNYYLLLERKEEKLKEKIVNTIIENHFQFNEDSSYPISFKKDHVYLYLYLVFDPDNLNLFEKLSSYVSEQLIKNESRYVLIYKASRLSDDKSFSIPILEYLLRFKDEIEEYLLLIIYRDILYTRSNNFNLFSEIFDEYLNLFKNSSELLNNDIYLFTLRIKQHSDRKNLSEALRLCDILADKIEKTTDEDIKLESVIIYYWYANLYFTLKDKGNSVKYADISLNLIKNANGRKMSMIDEKGLKTISDQLNQIKISSLSHNPITRSKKIGRNDFVKVQYTDGKVVEKKYKHIEADLLAERCILI